MGWKRLDVEFTLKSPLHIGYLPSKGSVISPTRYYVPGKNFWGAITKRLTEHLYENPRGKNYQDIGNDIKENFRFTYFYIHDGNITYLPEFNNYEGLVYGEKNKKITRKEFENRFIGSRVMTALDKNGSGTAEDGSLHETEFINNHYKDKKGNVKNTKIIGCIFIKNRWKINRADGNKQSDINIGDDGILIDNFNLIEKLILGGEQKYGFGVVELTGIGDVNYPFSPDLDNDEIIVKVNGNLPLLSHLEYSTYLPFKGDIELVSGREYPNKNKDNKRHERPGEKLARTRRFFAPGTFILRESEVSMDHCGMLTFEKHT